MILLQNSKKFSDIRAFKESPDCVIDFFSGAYLDSQSKEMVEIDGFFDVIKNTMLVLFCKEGVVYVGGDGECDDVNLVSVCYEIKEAENRILKIEFPSGGKIELYYGLKDLIEDPVLLLGSHEEVEDYDFGCYVYNVKNSPERQSLMREK